MRQNNKIAVILICLLTSCFVSIAQDNFYDQQLTQAEIIKMKNSAKDPTFDHFRFKLSEHPKDFFSLIGQAISTTGKPIGDQVNFIQPKNGDAHQLCNSEDELMILISKDGLALKYILEATQSVYFIPKQYGFQNQFITYGVMQGTVLKHLIIDFTLNPSPPAGEN